VRRAEGEQPLLLRRFVFCKDGVVRVCACAGWGSAVRYRERGSSDGEVSDDVDWLIRGSTKISLARFAYIF